MPSEATLRLLVELEDKASAAMSKIGGAASAMGGVVGTAAKGIGQAMGGVALGGVGALSAALVSGMADAREAAVIMAQTESVITSTGGAAGVSAEHVADYASSLSAAAGQSLFGDDQVQQSENLLLTFTNIKGETLDLATAMSVDLAQAMGGAPADSAIQLGKALNDPIAGISALSRVGVTFTDQQKSQIETMVEANDVAGAQAIILSELNREFGGSAKAAADADGGFAQFKDRMGEAAETAGGALLPIMTRLFGFLNTTVAPIIEQAASGFAMFAQAIFGAGDPIQNLLSLLDTLIPGFADAAASAYQWGANIVSQLAAGMGAAVDAIISVINTIASIISYWFAPGSPPKVAPEIDQWGAAAGTEFFAGMADGDTSAVAAIPAQLDSILGSGMDTNGMAVDAVANYWDAWTKDSASALTDLGGQVNTALKGMVDVGALGELDRIPALQNFRGQMSDALIEMGRFGEISETTWNNVVGSLGPVKNSMTPVIRGYLDMAAAQRKVEGAQTDLDEITNKYKKQLDGLQTQLKSVQREYDKQLRPFNAQLDALSQQEDAIKRVQRAQDAKDTLKDPEATGEEKALARLELQRIELEKQMAPIEANRTAAVQAIQDQIDAAQEQRDTEVNAAQATLDAYTDQLDAATQLYQSTQARVQTIQESNGLLAEQAKLVEQAAKAAAAGGGGGGGGGGKGGGGGGGAGKIKMPGGAGGLGLDKIGEMGGKVQAFGTNVQDVMTKAKETVEGWRTSFEQASGSVTEKLGTVTQAWNTFKGVIETIAPIVAGIAAGFAAFSIIATVAGWIGAAVTAWGALGVALEAGGGIIGAIVAVLGGPLTVAIVAIAALVGVLTAAWLGNWGGIRDTLTEIWTNTIQPALADLQVWLATNIPIALQTLADFWTGTLQPALAAVWSFLQDNIFPVLQTLVDTYIAAAKTEIDALATLWSSTLYPAIQTVWTIIKDDVIPILQSLTNVEIAAVKLALSSLADIWTTLLAPALSAMWSFFNDKILPVLKSVADVVSGAVSSAFGGLDTKIGGVSSALSSLKSYVDNAVGWLNDLAGAIDRINGKSVKDFGSGGGSSGSFDAPSGGGSSNRSFAGIARIAATGPALDGVTKSMQQMATALTFVAERAHDVAIWDTISAKTKALAGDAKTTAELYKQLGNNVAFLADALTTYKEVEDKNDEGDVTGSHMEQDKIGLSDSQLAAFQKEFDKAAAKAYEIQKQFGQEAGKAYFESQSSYLQDEAKLQVAYNSETNDAKKAAIKQQMDLRWRQHEQELKALEEEQGAALDAIDAERQAADAAYKERMQQIMDLFNAQKKANLSGAADLYSAFADTAGTVGDMLASAYQDAYDKALDGMQPPDPGTLSNADLEKQYADYAAAVKAAEAAGQAAQAQIAQVQQQLAAAQQHALEISQIDPQAAADYYNLEKDYILQVSDLQQKLNSATTDEQKAAIQQQLDYLAQAHGFNEQLFQSNLDQYGQQLADAQQAAQDAASDTGDSALQTYAGQLAEMFRLFQQQLNSAVIGATGNALGLPGIATMPNLTTRNGFAASGNVTIAPGAVQITINGANKTDKELAALIEAATTKALQNVAQSAARKSR